MNNLVAWARRPMPRGAPAGQVARASRPFFARVWRHARVDYDAAHAVAGTRARAGDRGVKILDVRTLAVPEIRVVRFARFLDDRGYFSEPYRRSDLEAETAAEFLHGRSFAQINESYSHAGVVRGLHFQWNPFMGKLVRTISGRMVDLVLDIRLGSPTLGKIVAHDMPASSRSRLVRVDLGAARLCPRQLLYRGHDHRVLLHR